MKRSSMALITFITAAITFGTLVAIAGDKRMGYNHYGCHNQQWRDSHNTKRDKPEQPNISPSKAEQ